MPVFSILLPVYNAEDYVSASVQSIIDQSFVDWELVAVNDGSRDASGTILNSFCKKDRRIKCLHQANTGIVGALNLAIANSSGEIMVRADADDFSMPNRLATLSRYFDSNKTVDIVGSGWRYMSSSREWSPPFVETEDIKASFIFGNHTLAHPTVALRRQVFENPKTLYDPDAKHVEDYDLWIRLSSRFVFANIKEALYVKREHPESITRKHGELMASNAERFCRRLLRQIIAPPSVIDWDAHRWLWTGNRPAECSIAQLRRWLVLIMAGNSNTHYVDHLAMKKTMSYFLSRALANSAGTKCSDFFFFQKARALLNKEHASRMPSYLYMSKRYLWSRLRSIKNR